MSTDTKVKLRHRLVLSRVTRIKHEENFSVVSRRKMEVVHSLIPDGHFSARHIARDSPIVRLTFNKYCGVLTSQIKSMNFGVPSVTDGHWKILLKS